MRLKNAISGRAALAASIAAILVLAGCAAKTAAPGAATTPAAAAVKAPSGTVLEYKMPAGRALTYTNSEEMAQVMEVMGQTVDSHTKGGGTITFSAKGKKDQNLLLGVTIDDMSMTISGPTGNLSPDLSPVKGKSFDMVVSPLGSEVDVSAAEAITYQSANGTANVASGFKLFFPDLPGKPIKVGDTWPSSSGAEDKSEGMAIKLDFQYVNTFEGLETIDGMECARIRSQVTGTLSGTGNQQGMDMTISGTGKGTDLWYFAVKEGIYVKATSDATYELAIAVSAAGMTIPMTQTRKSELKLTAKK
jgi:hypothetical protein